MVWTRGNPDQSKALAYEYPWRPTNKLAESGAFLWHCNAQSCYLQSNNAKSCENGRKRSCPRPGRSEAEIVLERSD